MTRPDSPPREPRTPDVALKISNQASTPPTWLVALERGRKYRLGRRSRNDIVIVHPCISREHLDFHWQNGELYVTDLGSRNGTLLNGRTLTGEHPLNIGDCLRVNEVTIDVCRIDDPEIANLAALDSESRAALSKNITLHHNRRVQAKLAQYRESGRVQSWGPEDRPHSLLGFVRSITSPAVIKKAVLILTGCGGGLIVFYFALILDLG